MKSTAERIRNNMIYGQIATGHVMDASVIQAMADVPRELFVGERYDQVACVDDDLPLSRTRYLMEPLTFARMLELAEIKPTDTVLDLGCATGYSTAVIARLAKHVVGVEDQRELAEKARHMVDALEISNAEIITGAQISTFSNAGPYDAVVISGGAVRKVPRMVVNLLAEGGRLVVVENVGTRPDAPAGLGHVLLLRKIKGAIYVKKVFDASVPLLPGFDMATGFSF